MSNQEPGSAQTKTANVIQLKLSSLISLCVSLIAATAVGTGLIAFGVAQMLRPPAAIGFGQPSPLNAIKPEINPPWGELVKYDLEVEQPDEYVAFEPTSNRIAKWYFPDRTAVQVRELLRSTGLDAKQTEEALRPAAVETRIGQTILQPSDELVVALTPEIRKNLYTELAQSDRNHYMRFPYCFMTNRAEEFFAKSGVPAAIVAQVSKLTYERDGKFYFSDVETVMNQIPTTEERQLFFKTLSRSSVVMARLRIRPDTDIDKLLGYWSGENVRQKDLKPLLESVKRRNEGGTVSLVYFLPPFARERLFTSPLPSSPGDPNMDCHWTAMNFFNSEPDFRFSDLTYTAAYVKTNFYPIAQPTAYGDIVFLLDREGNAIHSAVFIADDIVFTKNGNNYAQPWVMMRLPNLLALYNVSDTPRVACYRHKNS